MTIQINFDYGTPETDTVIVYRSKSVLRSQRWYWRRSANGGKKLSRSSEGYTDKSFCVGMALRCNPDKNLTTMRVDGGIADVDIQLPPPPVTDIL